MAKFILPEQTELSNGIPVVFQHYEGAVAATYWWVQTGSADEAPAEAGFAHFLEHMLFKDAAAKETGRASTGQMASAIESLGGDINAYTSFDQTVYHVTCASAHWERVIHAFGAIAKPQRFLRQDFEREREVILEELRKNEDSPGRQLFQKLFSETFHKHPYGKPVIGYVKTLKAAKVGALEAFYRRSYVPARMGLVLVGPLEDQTGARRKNILKLLEKYFGAKVLPRKSSASRKARVIEPALRKKAAFSVLPFDVKTPTLSFSFRVPDLMHEDMPALDVLSSIIGMGETSRVYQRLFYQTSLATEASGGLYVPFDPGMFYLQAEIDSTSKVNRVADESLQLLKRIGEEGPTDDELSRALVNAESERLYATQSADGMAGRLGFLRFIVGDLEFDQRYLEKLREVDAARIREAANRYFDVRRMSGVVLTPKGEEKFDTSEMAVLSERILSRENDPIPKKTGVSKKKDEIPVERFQLPSGMKVAFLERPQSHVFSVHISALGGVRLELARPIESAEADWGSSNLLAQTWTKGTASHDARTIASRVEGSAAGMDGFSGRNSVGLQLTGLSRDWGKLTDLLAEVCAAPVFPEAETDHSRRVAEDSVRGIEDHSSQLCSKLFLETLFDRHPYGRLTMGSLESLKRIDGAKLRAYHRMWIRPERLVVSVSGAVKRGQLDSWLIELDRHLREANSGISSPELPLALADQPSLKAPRWVEKSLGREQTHILVGGLGTRITAEDRHALRLLQNVLGGQSGRLFIELREKKSLAYTVAPVSFEGIEPGYAGTYIACAPQKKQEAIEGIRAVLEQLVRKGPTPQEMKRAQEYFLGRRAMDLQSDGALASHFGLETLYGIDSLTEQDLVRTIRGVSAQQIRDVCKKYLVDANQVTSIV